MRKLLVLRYSSFIYIIFSLVILTFLGSCSNEDNAYIGMNGILANLDGLNNVISIGGDLTISENPSLLHINALLKLKNVGGNAVIEMTSITNQFGLKNIEHIGGDLTIQGNTKLINYSGLKHLLFVEGLTGT